MSHVEITLKSGATITADVSEWSKQKMRHSGELVGFEWTHSGPRRLCHLDAAEVVAVVFVDDPEESK